MNQNFGPGKTTGHNAYAAACAADKAFQAELKRQFGERAGDFRYRRDCHDMKTAEARDAFKAATAAMRDHSWPRIRRDYLDAIALGGE